MDKLKLYSFLVLCLFFVNCQNQKSGNKTAKDFFPTEKAKVLVVGSFHFDYPGFDAHKTKEEDKIDVLEEPRKTELNELVDYIKKFRPNKIAIEADSSWLATQKLIAFKQGKFRDKRDERYQLGMRIANDLELDTLYAIDAWSMAQDIMKIDSVYTNNLWKDYDLLGDRPEEKNTKNWLNYEDSLKSQIPLLEYFKHMNSQESHQYGYGIYLQGDFKLDNYRGADIVSYWWYNRNVRIFRNLQKVIDNPQDRILVIFGNGHVPILKHLIESSPEMDLIDFNKL